MGMIEEMVDILLVEDEEAHAELIERSFEYRGDAVNLHIASSLSEARQHLAKSSQPPSLIIADWRLPDGDSLELLTGHTQQSQVPIPIIIMTSQGNERVAVDALKAGALDYVVKSQETLIDMPHIAERALREWHIMVEHQRVTEALRQSEAQFRLLAENSTDVITRHNRRGACLYASPACQTLLGYSPEEMLGQPVFRFIHHQDLPATKKKILSLLKDPTLRGMVLRVRHKNGKYIWVEANCQAILDPGTGKIIEVHSSSRDITSRVKAERELRASEDRFRSLVQNSDDLITVIDANGKITYESPSVTRITGYCPGYMVGKSPFDFIHNDDHPAGKDLQAIIEQTEQAKPSELRFRHANGEWIYLEVLGTDLLNHPGIGGIVLTSRDITQRKRSEIELQNAHKNLSAAYDDTILGWSRAMDLRDKETEGHTLRVTEMTLRLAKELGFSDEELIHIRHGVLLHDIGKMGIPDEILQKPGQLSNKEWGIMRRHPEYAYKMLSDIEYLRPALNIPYCHHERWDGTGYPRQLKGEEIPLEARLFSIVDVWDALSFDRSYRKAWPQEKVIEYIKQQVNSQFDPRLVDIFLDLLKNNAFENNRE